MRHLIAGLALSTSALALAGCVDARSAQEAAQAEPTAADAAAFLDRVETTYSEVGEEAARISWVKATNITYDTNWLEARMAAELTEMAVEFANEAARFDGLDLPEDQKRKLALLKQGITLPAPTTAGAAEELAQITTRLDSTYSTGTIDFRGDTVPQNRTEVLMRELRDPAALETVWTEWRKVSKPMKDDYVRMVEIANAGAEELGYDDLGQMWRSGYDMDPDEFADEVDRLWGQVKPLYEQLHCTVRSSLNEAYGDEIAPLDQPIRADILGNMWAQSWAALYGDIVRPANPDAAPVDIQALLERAEATPLDMVRTAEGFFTSLGFEPLPETFYERSQITKPEGREVVCHASAWNLDSKDDVRIKMCTEVNADDFVTVHHELGHNFYQRAYNIQPTLFQSGANDGFHEAIGDMIALSITPEYLVQIGLLEQDEVPAAEGDIDLLMQQALSKVAFLPFGLLVDKWRWEVFSGELSPEEYNSGWWDLREEYQGIRPPAERPADAFDPGAKYHVPGNTPYMRYFLAHILQFQFYKAACDQIGWEGPLHRCSFYNSKEVGERLDAMLEAGQSQPWPDTLELFTGSRELDASAVLDYFEPLMRHLEDENEGRSCGW
ncbi:M2 family metallopeptidase [Parvularcula oceani]|uniref:M2 family metallopeptidase n=1 Tax=Parvularcula oceani TaxID=1247963 RepID=UPI0004E13582|nr:M2 family metallopeptidase [Parvularcula oceani]